MNAELFIHGPRNAFYGASSEIAYSKLFDNSSIKDEIRFVVEVRKSSDGNRYAYYTYCRYSNVQDYGGRNGAYIGLSVRLDSYYTNLRAMYTVLEAVFNKGAIGLLVDKTPNGFQYRVEAFEPVKQQILERIERLLGSYLSNLYNPSEFITIDDSFKKGQDIIKGIDDNKFTEARLLDIKSSGKIIFASSVTLDCILDIQKKSEQILSDVRSQHAKEFETVQKESEQALEGLRSQYEKSNAEAREQYDAIASKYEDSKQKVSSLEESYNQKQEENRRLQSEKEQLQTKFNRLSGYAKDINQLKDEVGSLKKKIDSLENENLRLKRASVSSSHSQKGSQPNYYHKDDSFKDNAREIKDSNSLSSLGEGLRKHSLAFFLVIALVTVCVAALLLGSKFLSHRETANAGKEPKAATEQIVEPKEMITQFPNSVSKLLYPSIEKSDETIIIEGNLSVGSELTLSMVEYQDDNDPEFNWEIKGPTGVSEKRKGLMCKFSTEHPGLYDIKVFVDQSLVGLQRITIK